MAERCKGLVYVPEQMRYTGRGKSGFERNYIHRQCRNKIKHETGYCRNCRVHRRNEIPGLNIRH